MKVVVAQTEEFFKRERTTLAAVSAAGSNITLTTAGNTAFTDPDYIIIGPEGRETAEFQQVNQAVTHGASI